MFKLFKKNAIKKQVNKEVSALQNQRNEAIAELQKLVAQQAK